MLLLFTGCEDQIVNVVETQQFEGTYTFENGGVIELIQHENGEVTLNRSYFELVSQNKNDTYANHPTPNINKVSPVNGVVTVSQDLNYKDGSQFDVEADDGDNITGQRKTVTKLSKIGDKLKVVIEIYANKKNNNINFLETTRILESL
jgi:hypothetical protein